MMKVALAIGSDRRKNILRALRFLMEQEKIPEFQTCLIKPNLTGISGVYCNTSKEAVRALIEFLNRHHHPRRIYVGEGSGAAYVSGMSTWHAYKNMDYERLREIENVELINLDEWPHQLIFTVETIEGKQKVHLAKPEVDFIISLALPKTHDIAIVTLGLKNMMGLILPEDRRKIHGYTELSIEDKKDIFDDNELYLQSVIKIHGNISAMIHTIRPHLTVLDGFYGMEGDGPIGGEPIFHGFALASFDAVAADFVAVRLMGLEPKDIGYLYYLSQDFDEDWKPEIIGDDPTNLIKTYKLHRKYDWQKLWRESSTH